MSLDPETATGGRAHRQRPPLVRLIPVGDVDPALLDAIRPGIATRFHAPVRIGAPIALHPAWFDDARAQYHAEPILDALIVRDRSHGWSLGIADVDLFIPGLDFIFGEATVAGCCAVIGVARLDPTFHGAPPHPERFLHRVLTEAVHELGHIAGLDHCTDPRCVMSFSRDVDDVDRKGPDFCPRCAGPRSWA